MLGSFLGIVEEFVNAILGAVTAFLRALGIDVDITPIDI